MTHESAVRYARIEQDGDLPPAEERVIDIALLDMNHRWPNMGHDALVHIIRKAAMAALRHLPREELGFRVLSFDVRAGRQVPERAGDRFLLYVGTGGPGHIDPARNDGIDPASQGITEDPSWEPRVFDLFDSIHDHQDAALIAVCHSFGILCRWSGAAEAVLRSERKGGKSSGLVLNALSAEAAEHPWFVRFATELPDRSRLTVIDNRLFDLIPRETRNGTKLIAFETLDGGATVGEAVTMIELARDRGGVMPRIFGVNHHPEVIDRAHALTVLETMVQRGDVTREWYEERAATLRQHIVGVDVEAMLRLTSQFTLLFPLQFYLRRLLRLRAESLGLDPQFSESEFLDSLMDHARSGPRLEG